MTNDQQIAQTIRQTFESKLDTFSPERQRHFAERLYRLTGDNQYLPYLQDYLKLIHGQFLFYLNISQDKEKIKAAGRKIISQMRTKSWIKYYKTVPEIRYYQKLIFYLNKFREYQVSSILNSPQYHQALEIIKTINLKKYFLNQKLIEVIPGQTTNYIFWLERLKIINLFNDFFPLLEQSLHKMKFQNQAYGLTHVIIADSDYYQHFVPAEKYPWITRFLTKNLKAVLATENKDLIAETGVTFKLIKNYPDLVEKIKEHLRPRFNPNPPAGGGYFTLKSKKKLEDLEHTNVLAIFLFSDWHQLYPGPRIILK